MRKNVFLLIVITGALMISCSSLKNFAEKDYFNQTHNFTLEHVDLISDREEDSIPRPTMIEYKSL